MAQQIKHALATVTWPEGSGELVFGALGAYVFAGPPSEDQIPPGFPWALIWPDTGTPDEDSPDLIEQGFTIAIGAEVAGDPLGEHALIGGSVADLGQSAGRGVGEVMRMARQAVEDLVGSDGAQIHLSSMSTGTPAALGGGRHVAVAELGLRGSCTSDLHYSAPQELTASGGALAWDGSRCSNRFDFLRYKVVSVAGSSPPTNANTGTEEAITTSPGWAGPTTTGRTYAIFAQYNSRGGVTVDGSSDPEVGSFVAL